MLAATAYAQTAPAPDSASTGSQIQEVIVTANRQAQNLQKVSSAVQVVAGATLTQEGLSNVAQIVQNLPSVQATGQPGGFSIDIRGLGGDLPAGSTQGSTALEFDGVYNINSQGATVGFFDVDRIEVLPGPQSTRYGPDADGGVVNVITKDPVIGKLGGSVSLTGGNYGLFRTESAVNLPINDQLAIRLSEATINRSSYFTPAEGNSVAQSFRAKILYRPTDRLQLKLSYQLDHVGGTGNGSNVFPVFTTAVPIYSNDAINHNGDPWKHGASAYETYAQSPASYTADLYQHTLLGNLNYQFNDTIALDLLQSYTTVTGGETGCIYAPPWSVTPGGPFPICGAQEREFAPFNEYSTEVRFHNAAGSKILWNLGYYHWNYLWQSQLANASFFSSPPTKTSTETNALFGEVTYPVSNQLRLIGGLRESFDHREFNFNNSGVVTPSYGINFSHFDYRAGAEYDVTPSSMAYATVSTGYRPGGLSSLSPVTHEPVSFASESTTAFEFGAKNRFLDNRLQFNADVFYYIQTGYQNLDKYNGFTPADGTNTPCGNGDSRAACQTPTWNLNAHNLGFETQVRFRLTNDDVFSFQGTWMDARFDKNQGTCGTVGIGPGVPGYSGPGCYDGYNNQNTNALQVYNMAGAVQPHSPDFSGTASYAHTFPLPNGDNITAGGDVFYSTGYWLNPVEDADHYGYQPNYWLAGANLTYNSASKGISVNAYIHNISDYAVKMSVLPATSIGDPRTFGIVVTKRW